MSRYLHFADNTTLTLPGNEGYIRLGKVRRIIELITSRFMDTYDSHKESSIDQAMVAFKGRDSMKQYMPKKLTKRGFKIWMRADGIDGYVSDLSVYTGKVGDRAKKDLGGIVVRKLTKCLENKGFHVYFDNYFSSISLSRYIYLKLAFIHVEQSS